MEDDAWLKGLNRNDIGVERGWVFHILCHVLDDEVLVSFLYICDLNILSIQESFGLRILNETNTNTHKETDFGY